MSIRNSLGSIGRLTTPLSRRDMLLQSATGFGAVALAGLMGDEAVTSEASALSPLSAKLTHHPAKAKSVIFLFMEVGPVTWIPSTRNPRSRNLPESRSRKVLGE